MAEEVRAASWSAFAALAEQHYPGLVQEDRFVDLRKRSREGWPIDLRVECCFVGFGLGFVFMFLLFVFPRFCVVVFS